MCTCNLSITRINWTGPSRPFRPSHLDWFRGSKGQESVGSWNTGVMMQNTGDLSAYQDGIEEVEEMGLS